MLTHVKNTLVKNTLGVVLALGISASSAMADLDTNKALAIGLLEQGLTERNRDFITQHVAEDYIQHNPLAADKREGLLAFVDFLDANAPDFSMTPARVFGEGDLVVVHSEANFFGPKVIIDLFRFENSQIVEHWDAIQETVTDTANGRTMTDGPTEATDLDQSNVSKKIVLGLVQDVLIGGNLEMIDTYIAPDYKQHNPFVGDTRDGLKQFIQYLGECQITFGNTELHNVVAEGNFVVTQAEGIFGGKPTAFYDIWRVENGQVAEHWDVVQEIPAEFAHENGMF